LVVKKSGDKKDDFEIVYWEGGDYVWTRDGDSLFLRDSDGDLVLYYNY